MEGIGSCEAIGILLDKKARISRKKRRYWAKHKLKEWGDAVKRRDGRRCVGCGSTKDLQAHHIKPKSKFPEFALDVENGETVCTACHYLRHPELPQSMFVAA